MNIPLNAIILKGHFKNWEKFTFDLAVTAKSNTDFHTLTDFFLIPEK